MIDPLDVIGAIAWGILFALGLLCAADCGAMRTPARWLASVALVAVLAAVGAAIIEVSLLGAVGG